MKSQSTAASQRQSPIEVWTVYSLVNRANGRRYVGCTSLGVERRLRLHRSAARRGVASPLYRAMRKHGGDAFEVQVVELLDDPATARTFERAAVAVFGTQFPNGYNVKGAGQGVGPRRRGWFSGWREIESRRAA